jgi:hypothetical protein
MRRRDVPIAILAAAVAPTVLSSCNGSADAEIATYPRTAQEIAGSVVPTDYTCRPGAWRRYGADPGGQADSTNAIAIACAVNGFAFDDVGGTYMVSGPIRVPSNCTISGKVNQTELVMLDPDTSLIVADETKGVTIEGIRFRVPAASAVATGVVVFFKCVECVCRNCDFSGFSWAGAWLYDARNCTVTQCYFHDSQGSLVDSADICVYNNSSDNIITDNRCFGGNFHGVLIQNPYNDAFPSRNLVARNHIVNHQAYGVCLYVPDEGDTHNHILDNRIEDIRGTFHRASGTGIYAAGGGAGGTVIDGNTLMRCCTETRFRIEAPGAIGIHGMTAANSPIAISNNVIDEMAHYDGILIVESAAQVIIIGNNVHLLSGNTEECPIRVELASQVTVKANILRRPPTDGRCILVYASGGAVADVTVSSNTCCGGNDSQIDFYSDEGGYFDQLLCFDNTCSGGGDAASCISVAAVNGATVSGNNCTSAKGVTFYIRDARDLKVANNTFNSEGPVSVVASGACTGSVYAASNSQNGAILDSAVGLLVE